MLWKVLVVGLIPFTQVLVAFLAVTTYLHRDLSHGSINLSTPARTFCRIQIFYVSGMKPREWVAIHRKHHKYSDREGDPHSPVIEAARGKHRGRGWGIAKVLFGTAWLYRKVTHNTSVVQDFAPDVPVDEWDRKIFDHALLGPALVLPLSQLVMMNLIFGFGFRQYLAWVAGMTGFAILFFLLGGGIINALGHTAKVRDIPILDFEEHTDDHSKNLNTELCLLTVGEGSHHYHHLDPGSAKFARHAIWDPGWCFICVLQALGLAKVNRHVHVW